MPLEEEEKLTDVSWSGKWMVTVFPAFPGGPHILCVWKEWLGEICALVSLRRMG